MDKVLTSAVRLVNFIKDHKLPAGAAALILALAITGITVAAHDGGTPSSKADNLPSASVKSAQTVNPSSFASNPITNPASTGTPTTSNNSQQVAANNTPTPKSSTATNQTTTATSSVSTAKPGTSTPPATTKPVLSVPSPSPSPTTAVSNPNATFAVSLNESANYKDKATNTLYSQYVVTREPNHTAEVSVTVTAYGNGVVCKVGANNSVSMTFDTDLPANFYGCQVKATDGKTIRTTDFMIHHSGGPTNS